MRRLLVLLTATTLAACGTNGDGSLPGPGSNNQINLFQKSGTALTTSASASSALHFSASVSAESFTVEEHNFTGVFTVKTYGACLLPQNGTVAPTGTTASNGTIVPPYTTTVGSNGTLTFSIPATPACLEDGHVETMTVTDGLGNQITEYFSILS